MAAARARIYLDHNATTPVDPDVIEAVAAAMRDDFGNASSVHHFGQQAKARLDDARQDVAALIGGAPTEVVFTSGGTEADNFALRGVAEALEPLGKRHLVTSSIEHEAVLTTMRALERRGWRVTRVAPDRHGVVQPDAIAAALDDDTALLSLMHANNEIGTLQPVAACASARARARHRRAHRCRAVGRQGARGRARRSTSICSVSRDTSCTARRASARCGFAAARACSRR